MTIALSQAGAFSNIINANSTIYGADPTGTNDSTTALQTAATAAVGKTLFIPKGNYRISAPIVFQSNTRVFGQGLGSRIFTTAGTGFGFFINNNLSLYGYLPGNYGVTLDTEIIIEDMYFDYGSLNDGGTHAVAFRLAQNCFVQRCQFNGGNDATSILASKNMTVRDCVMTGCTNVGADHWDGVENCLVENCTITMQTATSVGQNTGIMFTAASTTPNGAVRTTKGCIARGNKIYNAGVGIFVNELDTSCTTSRCAVVENSLYGCLGGVYLTGSGGYHQVLNTYVEGGGGASSSGILVRIAGESGTANPNNCRISGTVANDYVAGAVTGMMNISGLGHTLGDLSLVNGSGILNGTVYWVNTAASGCVIEGAQMLDAASISAVTYGLFQGNNAATTDTNCTIRCWDGFASYQRYQGGADNFSDAPTILSTTSVPAGGTAGSGLKFSSVANLGVFFGSGAPSLSAAQGSLYIRTDGSSTSTRMYINTNGSTTWTNVTTAA